MFEFYIPREDKKVANRPVCYLGEFRPRKYPKTGNFGRDAFGPKPI